MCRISCFLAGFILILDVAGNEYLYHSGRRICSAATESGTELHTQSYVEAVHKPYMKTCEGPRLCSTYRTTYKVAYRQVFRKIPQQLYACCPGWRRTNQHPYICHIGPYRIPCQNGGRCTDVHRCDCPLGWSGKSCQTDVDECSSGSHACGHQCVNTAGSYQCTCLEGYRLSADGKSCQLVPKLNSENSDDPPLANCSGASDVVKGDTQELRNRVDILEQKLHQLLAAFHSLRPLGLDEDSSDQMSWLAHSFQKLDRIDSLSEQISFLEERLETCSCKNEL
ncbi:epidermal growth factor-like protein 7 [Microcaecilia unicolor]|uniref:Epidermal growth factor-like protein 7 n=1 Tax=Microcaecilia unicolor TaxID=1415580 RepID=A0A6P7YEN4_9AMPH|nr:epidermal growth factor-like protein 7 [Microcaecilia unicolor]XP_030063504.1 epidermal growth factor-like protein 7 [Microcaecilia unicolor]XP_030063505.1 epidermal growth factor-like protein 7 [Microcaecilia unicolor]